MRLGNSGDVRFDAIAALEQSLEHYPNSTILDRAIDLALSPRRKVTNAVFLYRNVVRDARILECRRNRHESLDPLDALSPLARKLERGACEDLVTSLTPELILNARLLEAEIRATLSAEECGCLDCMLDGDSVRETAARVGASERHVKRLRARIREVATLVIMGEAA